MLVTNIRFVVTMNPKREIIRDGAILIEGDRIADIGKSSELSRRHGTEETLDGTGMVALPGLIKAHTHSPMTLFRGYADDMPLMEWLNKIWALEAKLNPEDCYWGSLLACLELTSFGVTTFSDMYLFPEQIRKAVHESGLRAVIAPAIFEGVNPKCNLKSAEEFMKKGSEMVIPALGPHSPYGCSREELKETAALAAETGAMIHTHASETRDEVRRIKKRHGMTPVKYLNSVGLLTEKTILAHTVWITNEEIRLISKAGAKVVHCPISNMKLASGVAPVHKMEDITVSLGSDGPCSNNNLDMFEEKKAAALLHKVHNLDPTLVPAEQALEMATINGAISLGLKDVGSLERGKRADLILLNFRKPHLTPVYNPVSHLVYSCNGNDVDTTICNGRVLMNNRKLVLDAGKVMTRVDELKEELLKR